MSKIKSALELALEKTGELSINSETLRLNSLKKEGRVIASRYLRKELTDLKGALKEKNPSDRAALAEGITETLLANLILPRRESDLEILSPLEKALIETGLDKKMVQEVFRQLAQIFQQYLQTIDQMTAMLKKQYEPQLRAKEQKLRQQTGQDIRIEAERDPEFNRILADRLGALEDQYQQVLHQAREELKKSL